MKSAVFVGDSADARFSAVGKRWFTLLVALMAQQVINTRVKVVGPITIKTKPHAANDEVFPTTIE